MAQYGKNFYGSAYYGETNAFSGTYETKAIYTEEDLKGTFDVNITGVLPDAKYGPTAQEITRISGTWNHDAGFGYISSNSPRAELRFRATCDRLIIRFERRSTAPTNVNVEITTREPGKAPVVTNHTFNPNSATIDINGMHTIDNLAYGMQEVRIFLNSNNPSDRHFRFKGIDARVAHFTVETRARKGSGSWTSWAKLNMTKTSLAGVVGSYLVKGTSPDYKGRNFIQVKVWLASSDNEITPILDSLETIAGDSENRTEDGKWEAIIDMHAVAGGSANFRDVVEIDWEALVPETTKMIVRTSSSTNKTTWTPDSVPYIQGVNRLRLKAGFNEGFMDLPYIQPSTGFTRTLYWDNWDDQSFLPPDSASVEIRYSIMDVNKDELNPILAIDPMKHPAGDRSFLATRLKTQDFFLRVRLKRRFDKATPVVDWIRLTSWMEYKQEREITNFDISPVDNNNTGEKEITKISNYTFNPPPEVKNPEYILIDETGRPNDVSLYYGSEKTALSRTHKTLSKNDTIFARAETRELGRTSGIRKHYQYGGGTVQFPLTDKIEMDPAFTPSLSNRLRYRYYLLRGWPTVYHTVREGNTLESIAVAHDTTVAELQAVNPSPAYDNEGKLIVGQSIQIPNNTDNQIINIKWASTSGLLTDKSSHNARLQGSTQLESDIIEASIAIQMNAASQNFGLVDWTSGEKIYDGVVNPNDIRYLYRRRHNTPLSGDSAKLNYIVADGDTYTSIAKKFGIEELDLRIENDARNLEEQPVVGERITVPALITLPTIDPKAVIGQNPYHMTIVNNSVRKKDGTRLPDSAIVPVSLDVEYVEDMVRGEEVVRGPIANGKDLLSKPRVTEIISVYTITSGVRTNYNQKRVEGGVVIEGSFTRDGNYINWGEVGPLSPEPNPGTRYFVEYKYLRPKSVTVSIDTTYQEEGGVDRIWRSVEVKEFKGMCFPGKDHSVELPPFSAWRDANDPHVEDFEYIIEDNDLWVKTWVEERDDKYYAIGSLQDRVPKDNWFPTIQTGYYYLGKDEYYLFNEPIIIEPTDREIAIAKNVEYGPGKFGSAVYSQHGSINLVRNSGFEISTSKETVFKLSFDKQIVAAQLGGDL